MYKLLIVNPGSTSTKIAVYEDENPIFERAVRHSAEELSTFETIALQYEFRLAAVVGALKDAGIDLSQLDAIIARGGMMRSVPSGIYEVNDAMYFDLSIGFQGQHASNLGGLIARRMGDELGIKAYIADPVVVDEMEEIAKVTGVPELRRSSLFHALNQKAVARRAAADLGRCYEECRFIVAHLGGGISVGAHKDGRVIDVNNALMGDGPFSPERAGTVPSGPLINLCYQGFDKREIERKFQGNAGMAAYLGTSSAEEVIKRIDEGDVRAEFIYRAMAYNIAKEIGAMSTVLEGRVDRIIITGGLAYETRIVRMISDRVGSIAAITVIPGEEEISTLAERGLALLRGEAELGTYG